VKHLVQSQKTNENPLNDNKQMKEGGFQLDSQQYENQKLEQEDSDDDETRLEKQQRMASAQRGTGNMASRRVTLGQKDPLAEYKQFEKEKELSDFEVWDAKKLKIMEAYSKKTEGTEVMIGAGADKDIDRPIRMGQSKSRLDQLEQKTSSTKAGTLISARDFTI